MLELFLILLVDLHFVFSDYFPDRLLEEQQTSFFVAMTSLCKKEASPKRFNAVHGGNVSYNKQAFRPFSRSHETEKSNSLATIDDQKSNWNLCRGQRERARNPSDTSSERSRKTFQDKVPKSGARPKTEVFSRYPKLSDATSSKKQAASKSDQVLRERMRSTKKTSKGCSGTPLSAASEVELSLIDDETLSALNLLPGCIKEEEPLLLVPPDLPMAFEQKIGPLLNKELPSSQSGLETDDYALIGGWIPLNEASFTDSDIIDFKAEASFFKDCVSAVDFSLETHADVDSAAYYNLPAIVPSIFHMDSSLPLTSLSASSDIEYSASYVERQMPADETDISVKEEYQVVSAVEEQNFLSQMSPACCITRPKQVIACDAHEAGSLLCEREEKSVVSKKSSRSIRSWLDCSNSIDGLKTEPIFYNKLSPSLERDRKLVAFEQSKGDDMREYGFLDFAKVFTISQDEEPLYWPLDIITSTDNQSTIDSSSWLESMTDSISSSCDFSQCPSGEECINSILPSVDKVRAESYTRIRKEKSKKESAVSFSNGCCTSMRKQKGDKEKTKDTKKNVVKPTTETWTRTPKLHLSVEENGGVSKGSRVRNRENTQSCTGRNLKNGIQCQKDRLQKRSIVSRSQNLAAAVKTSTSFSNRHAPSRCHSDVVLSSLTISDTEFVSVEGSSNAGYISSNCSYIAQSKDCSLERLSRELFDGVSSHVKRSARANVHSTDIKNSVLCENLFCPQFLPSNILDSTFAFGINDDLTGSSIETLVGMAEFDGREGMDKCSLLDMCPVIEKSTSQAVSCIVGPFCTISNGPPHTSIENRGSAGTQWSLKEVNTEMPDSTRMLHTNLHGNKGKTNGSFSFNFTNQATGDMKKTNPLSSCTSGNCEYLFDSPFNESTYTSTLSEFSKNNAPKFWQDSEKDIQDCTEKKHKEGFLALSLSSINKQNPIPQFQKQADCCQQSFSIPNPLEVHDRCLKERTSCKKSLSLGFIQDRSFTVPDSKESLNCIESQETSANEFTATSLLNSSASCSVDSLVEVQARREVSQKVIRSLVYNEDKRRVEYWLDDAFRSCTTSSSSSSIISPTRSITGGGSPLEKVEVFRGYEPSSLAHQKSGKARGAEDRSTDTKCIIQDKVSPVNYKCSQKEWNNVEEVERSMSWKPFDRGCFAAKSDFDEDFQVDNILESELKCKCVTQSMADDLFALGEFDSEENFLFVHNVKPNEDIFLSSEIEQHNCYISRLEKPEFPDPEFQDFITRGSDFAWPFDCFRKQETSGMQSSGKVGKNEFSIQKCVAKEKGLGIHLKGFNKVSQNPTSFSNDIGSSVLIYKNPLWSEELNLNFEFHRRWHDKILCDLSLVWKDSEVLTDMDYGCNLSHVFLNDYFDIVVRIVDSSLQASMPHNPTLLYSNPLSEDVCVFDATNDHGTSEFNGTFELKDFSMCKFLGHIDVHTGVSSINEVLTKDCMEMNSLICDEASIGDIEVGAGIFAAKHEKEADQTMMCGCLIKEARQLARFCDKFFDRLVNASLPEHNVALDASCEKKIDILYKLGRLSWSLKRVLCQN